MVNLFLAEDLGKPRASRASHVPAPPSQVQTSERGHYTHDAGLARAERDIRVFVESGDGAAAGKSACRHVSSSHHIVRSVGFPALAFLHTSRQGLWAYRDGAAGPKTSW